MSPALRRFFSKFVTLFRRGKSEQELTREIDAHLALIQEDFERGGMSPSDASLAARRTYGGVEQAKELHRAERSFVWIEHLMQDLRHALRSLARTPGFTLLAAIVLALGIGANTTLFSLYNAVALKPLPVADPGHVVRMERWFESHGLGDSQYAFSVPEYVYCRERAEGLSSLVAASWVISAHTSLPGSSKQTQGQLVSANYFDGLGIRPFLGRGFRPDEDQTAGANPVVVLGYRFWRHEFNGDDRVLGQTIKLNNTSFSVIGVAPESFTGTPNAPQEIDFWAPVSMQPQLLPGREWLTRTDQRLMQIFARLNDSADRRAVQAHLDLLIRQFATTYIDPDKTTAVTLQRTTYFPNVDDIRFQALFAGVMLIVGLVLFVACANVGNMLLARSAARQREMSTRLALGASRGRLIRQLLTESVLLSGLGGIAGLLLSIWTTKLLGLAIPQDNAMLAGADFSIMNLSPDYRVMLYTMAISLAAGLLFGLAPALRFTKLDITTSLKDEGMSFARLGGSKLRSFLVASQVAFSVLLLAIAGLLARGLVRSQAAEPEFHTHDVYYVGAEFGNFDTELAKATARRARLVDQLKLRPEIASVAIGDRPFAGTWTPPIIVSQTDVDQSGVDQTGGNPTSSEPLRGRTLASYASDAFFDTLGIPFLRGRNFTSAQNGRVAIITESTAHLYFPNQDPLGKTITLDMDFRGKMVDYQVIGIVKDVRFANLTRIDPSHVYLPIELARNAGGLDVLIRTRVDHRQTTVAVESATDATGSDLLSSLRLVNLDEGPVQIQRAISHTFAMLALILAALSLSLAGIGIYGVVAYLVSQRTREIGIRLALGATSRTILNDVVIRGLRPVIFGTVLGLVFAGALSAVLHQTLVFPGSMDFLYGIPFYDPLTFVSLICFVMSVAALASIVPSRRALRVDPMVALRYE